MQETPARFREPAFSFGLKHPSFSKSPPWERQTFQAERINGRITGLPCQNPVQTSPSRGGHVRPHRSSAIRHDIQTPIGRRS
jgi:hypothetical protein